MATPYVHEGWSAARSSLDACHGPIRFTGRPDLVEQPGNGPLDPGGDRIGRRRRIENHEPARLGDGHRQESVPDAAMEREVEPGLEAGLIVRRLACQPDLDR